jgi:hypothetical protein
MARRPLPCPDAGGQLGQQAEGDVRRLVVRGIAARDVAAERAQGGVLREGDRLSPRGAGAPDAGRGPDAADST